MFKKNQFIAKFGQNPQMTNEQQQQQNSSKEKKKKLLWNKEHKVSQSSFSNAVQGCVLMYLLHRKTN